jgi:hypothetical protein
MGMDGFTNHLIQVILPKWFKQAGIGLGFGEAAQDLALLGAFHIRYKFMAMGVKPADKILSFAGGHRLNGGFQLLHTHA